MPSDVSKAWGTTRVDDVSMGWVRSAWERSRIAGV